MNYKSWNFKTNQWYTPPTSPVTYIGNTGTLIDWDNVVNAVSKLPGKKVDLFKWDNPLFLEIKKLYDQSSYCNYSAEWINYYPEADFPQSINDLFGNFIKNPNIVRSWISRIDPGKTAPWHWDVDDHEQKYLEKGDLIRYTCKIGPSDPGHITVIGKCVLNQNQSGDTYLWPDHRTWHGSSNSGLTPKYQFNYLAYL
jgi:hypothetical protein